MSKQAKILEWIKNLVILVLFALMIVLLVSYFTQTRLLRDRGLVEIPIEQLLAVRGDETADMTDIGSYRSDSVLPSFIGYKTGPDSTPRGIFADEATAGYIYHSVADYLESLFTDASFSYYPAGSTVGAELWQQAISSQQYVYLKYPAALPFPLIATYVTGIELDIDGISDNTVRLSAGSGEDGGTELPFTYLSEIFILMDRRESGAGDSYAADRYTYYGVARDERGNVTLFRFTDTQATYYFDTIDIRAYDINKDFFSYDFYGTSRISESPLLADTAILTAARVQTSRVTLERSFAVHPASVGFMGLLSRLGYSGNINHYTEGEDTEVYVNSYGFLRVNPTEGRVTFEASSPNTGIPRAVFSDKDESDFFQSEDAGHLDLLYGCVTGVESLMSTAANALGDGFLGGDGHPVLLGVWREGDSTVVEYGCALDGVLIADRSGTPLMLCRFVFNGESLIGFSMNSLAVSDSGVAVSNYSTVFLTDRFLAGQPLQGTGGRYSLRYCFSVEANDMGIASDWVLVTVPSEEEGTGD